MIKHLLTAIGALLLLAGPVAAERGMTATDFATLAPNKFIWADDTSLEPVRIVVSIPDQRAYVYRGETLIAASSVSTGKGDKPTPTGIFMILQKEETHHSNLYDAAPMPFMQRLTWDGVALHAGKNPGFPASHGCIRMPTAFAKKLFGVTEKGTPVLVTEASAADGWTLPEPYDAAVMVTETAKANVSQLDTVMQH